MTFCGWRTANAGTIGTIGARGPLTALWNIDSRIFANWRASAPTTMPPTAAHRVSAGERINAHARPGRLQAALEKRGVRLTRQRKVLLEVMDNAERHLDAGAILERAQKIDPRVHRVTVYRTLDLLKLSGDQHFYESHGPRDHIHVACLKCGKVREFESLLYEKLKKQIEQDCDIKITMTRTEVGGYCENCRK